MPRGNISRLNVLRSMLRDKLRHNVDDENFRQIFSDFARLINTSVKLCERDLPFPEYAEEINNYIKELLGLSFLLLQAKIRRVSEAAAKAYPLTPFSARALEGPYKCTGKSRVELIWAVSNYYKHRDEWDTKVWKDKMAGEQEDTKLRDSRKTRRIIEKVGIKRRSTCNMRTAYNFFKVDWASDCTPLADMVQEWATAVYEKCANP